MTTLPPEQPPRDRAGVRPTIPDELRKISFPAPFTPLSALEKTRGIAAALSGRPEGEPFRVFAFGSLMWNPEMTVSAQYAAVLKGYTRCFEIWSTRARGTPELPGLGLCVKPDRAAACTGIVFELSEEALQTSLARLWDREQHTAVYTPVWLDVRRFAADAGSGDHEDRPAPLRALTFVVNQTHPLYAGPMAESEMIAVMLHACGLYGPNHGYLGHLLEKLSGIGVREPRIEALRAKVTATLLARNTRGDGSRDAPAATAHGSAR